jgi:hypothetical protein
VRKKQENRAFGTHLIRGIAKDLLIAAPTEQASTPDITVEQFDRTHDFTPHRGKNENLSWQPISCERSRAVCKKLAERQIKSLDKRSAILLRS